MVAWLDKVAVAKAGIAKSDPADLSGIMLQTEGLELFQARADEAAVSLGLTADQGRNLANAMDLLGSANGMVEVGNAASTALSILQEMAPAGEKLPVPLREAAFALEEIASKTREAVTAAGDVQSAAASIESAETGGNTSWTLPRIAVPKAAL